MGDGEQAPFNELQRLGLVASGDGEEGLAEKPGAENVAPIFRHRIWYEWIDDEDPFCNRCNCSYRRLRIAIENAAVGLNQ